MKKLFTLVALLACFLGAKAEWTQVYTIDYSTYQGFPFYVMGYVPEWNAGVMTDFGAMYKYTNKKDEDAKEEGAQTSDVIVKTNDGTEYYKIALDAAGWHQYFIADGISTKLDGKYKVIAKVRASEATSINVNMGWGWGEGQQASASVAIPADDFQEVEWEYSNINGTSCNLVAQPGTFAGTIEWQSLTVYEWVKDGGRVPEWLEDITNGDAETPWGDLANVKFNDQDNNFKICAWGKERMVNVNADGGWDPAPATIEVDPDNAENHVFVVHGKAAITEGDAAAWDNQFWIQSKHAWTSGLTVKIKFRYKASKEVTVATQCHKQNPSDYLIWHAIGDVKFTEDWQTFEKDMAIADDMGGTWSVAFQLNQNDKDAIDFYFDDLSWQYLKLDNGYFIAGINSQTTTSYDDLDNAIQFEDEDGALVATVGTKGDATTYVDQIMISTVRGDDQAFKGATLKPAGKIHNDPEEWQEYVTSTNSKLDLPGLGVWKVTIDLEYNAMAFEMLEGTEYAEPDPVAIVTNKTEFVVNATERDWRGKDNDGNLIEEQEGTGQPWDNQFWIAANRDLKKDEVTVVKFQYKSSIDAKTSTQAHKMGDDGKPCTYLNWQAIGDVNFAAGDWVDFEAEFKIPEGDDGMRSIVFNMAEIKSACDYYIKDVQWYLKDASLAEGQTYENLINEEGTENFWIKINGVNGGAPYQYGTDPTGISNVSANSSKVSTVTYNLAGQRVSNGFKGIVVKDGKKFVK